MGIKTQFPPPGLLSSSSILLIFHFIFDRNMQMVHTWKRNRRDVVLNMYKTPVMMRVVVVDDHHLENVRQYTVCVTGG